MTDTAVSASDIGLQSVLDVGAGVLRTAARVTYTTSYVLAYGVVFATVFVAKSIPRENPVMHGIVDGGCAATDALTRDGN